MIPSLRWLLNWASTAYRLETPNLEHSLSRTDDGGAPDLRAAIRSYLNLGTKRDDADDWARVARRVDQDGRYRTPFRAALSRIRDPHMRLFLRDLAPELYRPTDIADIHGVPRWAAPAVMHAALLALWREYQEAPTPKVGWVSQSESQRNAVMAGEA